jgi:broad specificity phosphatase PhoE
MTSRPVRLVLVRHGESLRNVAKKRNRFFLDDEARRPIQGIPDHRIGLTELGWRQARETGVAVRDRFGPFDQVYHSGYQRAVETTAAMLEAYAPDGP